MSEPKRLNIYENCITSAVDRELWDKIPEGEIVFLYTEGYTKEKAYDELLISRFNRDRNIGVIYSDLNITNEKTSYSVFLNDDNMIGDIPIFVVKNSNIDMSEPLTSSDIFSAYILQNQRVEHIAEPIVICMESAYDNKIHKGN